MLYALTPSDLLSLLLFILPAYVANATPVIMGGGDGIDGGMHWVDGRRVLGKGKTLRGTLSGILAGTIVGIILGVLAPGWFLAGFALSTKLIIAFLLSLGAMAGDIFGSFIKRRMGFADGGKVEFLDQLLFLAGALVFALPFFVPSLLQVILLAALTYLIHKLTNWAAHKLKLKNVPW